MWVCEWRVGELSSLFLVSADDELSDDDGRACVHDGQVIGIPCLLYFEGQLALIVGINLEKRRKRMREVSKFW